MRPCDPFWGWPIPETVCFFWEKKGAVYNDFKPIVNIVVDMKTRLWHFVYDSFQKKPGIMKKYIYPIILAFTLPVFVPGIETAEATQGHGAPEGLYVHQWSHVFFIFSLAILVYWLRGRKLVTESGWRYIQFSAVFFILWNIDAFWVHMVQEQYKLVQMESVDLWHIRIHTDGPLFTVLFYLAKLDHLLCVPAMIFMYLGLKKLFENNREQTGGDIK